MKKKISALVILAVIAGLGVALTNAGNASIAMAASTNLIQNPGLSADPANATIPLGWHLAQFGTNNGIGSYPVAGPSASSTAANVTITSYTNGFADWYPTAAPVTAFSLYNYTESYLSNVPTIIEGQYTIAGTSTLYYTDIASIPASNNGAWGSVNANFTAPTGATSLVIYHILTSAGSLTFANPVLIQTAGPQVFSKGMVSMTFDDGLATQYTNVLPSLQAANLNATFYVIAEATRDSVQMVFPSTDNPTSSISVATTSKSVTWGNIRNGTAIYGDPTALNYFFTDFYTASATSTVTATYQVVDAATGNIVYATGTIPVGTVSPSPVSNPSPLLNFTVNLPANLATASSDILLTITQSVATGTLTATNPLLTQKTQYMNIPEMLAVQAAGNEIGGHTETHPDLTSMSEPNAIQEIAGGRAELLSFGAKGVDTFAYPYGSSSIAVKQLVKNSGFIAARLVNPDYNLSYVDPFALKTETITNTTTFPMVQSWIDTAAANKTWVTLLFHNVAPTSTLTQLGDTYGTTPEIFQQIISYIQAQEQAGNIMVKTVHDAVGLTHS